MFTYANVDIVGDQVFIRYGRYWPIEREGYWPKADPLHMPLGKADYEQRGAEMTSEGVMRIYPLEWFYR